MARLDVMAKDPAIDMYNEIGMKCANFGVESFGKAAIKGAKKRSTRRFNYVVGRLRKEIPDLGKFRIYIWTSIRQLRRL